MAMLNNERVIMINVLKKYHQIIKDINEYN